MSKDCILYPKKINTIKRITHERETKYLSAR
jgi:hypothetical protein